MVKSRISMLLSRLFKGVAKAFIVIVVFLLLAQVFSSFNSFYPLAYAVIETYVVIYAIFIILGELTRGMIYEHMFGMGKAFFFISYSVYAMNKGIFTQTIQTVTFAVNLEVFLMMIILIGTLDFAKSLLQLINFMAAKAETEEILVIMPEQEVLAQ